jgi:hypothetical protein
VTRDGSEDPETASAGGSDYVPKWLARRSEQDAPVATRNDARVGRRSRLEVEEVGVHIEAAENSANKAYEEAPSARVAVELAQGRHIDS